jgi:hypothetical protein
VDSEAGNSQPLTTWAAGVKIEASHVSRWFSAARPLVTSIAARRSEHAFSKSVPVRISENVQPAESHGNHEGVLLATEGKQLKVCARF